MNPLLLLLLPFLLLLHHRKRGHLPPGPRPLPIIGNLNQLSGSPHRDVRALSKTYGPILHLRLGAVPTIFISSPSLAKQVIRDNDLLFPGRPLSSSAEEISYGFKGIGFTEYGPYWRGARKMCASHMFTGNKMNEQRGLRKEEMDALVEDLKEAAAARAAVDVTAKVVAVCKI